MTGMLLRCGNADTQRQQADFELMTSEVVTTAHGLLEKNRRSALDLRARDKTLEVCFLVTAASQPQHAQVFSRHAKERW